MNEHLQVLVVTHVVGGVLIYGTCVAERQVVHAQYHSLFVLCNQLCLTRVGLTADTRRQNIVHRRTVTVLLDVHVLHIHQRCTGRRVVVVVLRALVAVQTLVVVSPLAANQIQTTEAQVHLFLAACEVQTRETYRLEVTDRTHALRVVALQWDLELIPCHRLCLAVA